MTIFCLKFACGDDARTDKLCGDGNGDKTCGDCVGMGTRSAGVGMGTNDFVGMGWGWGRKAVSVQLFTADIQSIRTKSYRACHHVARLTDNLPCSTRIRMKDGDEQLEHGFRLGFEDNEKKVKATTRALQIGCFFNFQIDYHM